MEKKSKKEMRILFLLVGILIIFNVINISIVMSFEKDLGYSSDFSEKSLGDLKNNVEEKGTGKAEDKSQKKKNNLVINLGGSDSDDENEETDNGADNLNNNPVENVELQQNSNTENNNPIVNNPANSQLNNPAVNNPVNNNNNNNNNPEENSEEELEDDPENIGEEIFYIPPNDDPDAPEADEFSGDVNFDIDFGIG